MKLIEKVDELQKTIASNSATSSRPKKRRKLSNEETSRISAEREAAEVIDLDGAYREGEVIPSSDAEENEAQIDGANMNFLLRSRLLIK